YLQEPTRAYEQQLNAYNNQGTQLGVMGLEAGLRSQEATTRRAQELADRQLDAEALAQARRLGIQEQENQIRLRDSLLRQRQEAEGIRQADLLKQKQRLEFAKDLAAQEKFYRGQGVKDPTQAKRLALNDYGDYASQLGMEVPELTAGDTVVLGKVGAQIER